MRVFVMVTILIAVSSVVIAEPPSGQLRAVSLLDNINAQGPRAVVSALRSNSNQWDQVMINVGRGHRQWLDVAAALRPGTDAGSAEALDEAVFLALKSGPAQVLRYLKDGRFEIATVCSSNIATDYSDAQSRLFIEERIKVLQSVSDQQIVATRDQCLVRLHAAIAEFDNPRDKPKSN